MLNFFLQVLETLAFNAPCLRVLDVRCSQAVDDGALFSSFAADPSEYSEANRSLRFCNLEVKCRHLPD